MKHKLNQFTLIDFDLRGEASAEERVALLNRITRLRLEISQEIRETAKSANQELRVHYRHSIVPSENQRWVSDKHIMDRIEAIWDARIRAEIMCVGDVTKYWFDVKLAKELARYVVQYATSISLNFNHFALIDNEIRVVTIRGF